MAEEETAAELVVLLEQADQPVVTFDRSTVTLDALQRAAYTLAALMSVDIRCVEDDYVCRLFPCSVGADPAELSHRLRREVLDQTLRARIGEQTEPIRNLIFALAFSRTGLAGDEDPPP